MLNLYLENEKIINKITKMGIIYGYTNEKNFMEYNQQIFEKNDLISLIKFIEDNFYTFILAFFKKIYFYFFRIRPFYSDMHNLYIIIYNIIFYPLAIYGIFNCKQKKNLFFYFIISFIVIFSVTTGLTFADWSGRFSLYIIPFLFVFSSIGIDSLKKKINLKF